MTEIRFAQEGATHDQVPMCCCAHQVDGAAIVRLLQHLKGFSKAQVPQDIHRQPAEPVAHALGLGPALGLGAPRAGARAHGVAKGAHVGQDVPLHLLDGGIAEGVGHDAALAGVQLAVAAVVGVGGRVDEGIVELGLAHVGLEPVDVLEGGGGVEGQGIGTEAHDGAIALVHAPELEVAVAAVRVPELVEVGDAREEGAWVGGEGVQEQAVEDHA